MLFARSVFDYKCLWLAECCMRAQVTSVTDCVVVRIRLDYMLRAEQDMQCSDRGIIDFLLDC